MIAGLMKACAVADTFFVDKTRKPASRREARRGAQACAGEASAVTVPVAPPDEPAAPARIAADSASTGSPFSSRPLPVRHSFSCEETSRADQSPRLSAEALRRSQARTTAPSTGSARWRRATSS